MSVNDGAIALAWMSVYLGLAGFYFLAARRFPARGYAKLGGMMLCFAVISLSFWLSGWSKNLVFCLILGRAIVISGALAPPLHSQFMVEFLRAAPRRRLVAAGYILAASIIVCDFGVAASAWSSLSGQGIREFVVTAPELGVTMAALVLAHMAFAGALLYRAVRQGRRAARGLLLLMVCVGPAVAIDYGMTFSTGRGLPVSEIAIWIYGLTVALVLLSELRGAEGLLEQTTSSLAERTAELQVSYAELEQVQTELDEKERLAAVGELAAAIAHEVRNPLAVIMNASSGLRRPLAKEDTETLLAIIDEEAHRLNHLVGELLRFARPLAVTRGPLVVEELFRQIAADVDVAHPVVLEVDPAAELRTIWVDGNLIKFALESVIDNALLAMPRGGQVTLRFRRKQPEDESSTLMIEVEDQGSGMSTETLERARRPFFTTRPRGTGLGLPIVERIVREHGGELVLMSELQRGTRVTFCLPGDIALDPPSTEERGAPSSLRRRSRLRVPADPAGIPAPSPESQPVSSDPRGGA